MTLIKVTDKEYSMDNYTISNLNDLKIAVDHKFDGILLVDGMEGSGKSVFAASCAYYLTYISKVPFTIDHIVWLPEQFEKAVNKARPYTCIIFDEFVTGGLATDAMTKIQGILVKYFTMIRKKRLFIFLIIPYIFLLRPYFAIARSRALFHLTTPDGIQRGTFTFYNYEQKKYLFMEGKKFWTYPRKVPVSFKGTSIVRSFNEVGIDEEEYDKRKELAIQSVFKTKEKKSDMWKIRFYKSLKALRNDGKDWKEICLMVDSNMCINAIQNFYSQMKEEELLEIEAKKQLLKSNFKMPN